MGHCKYREYYLNFLSFCRKSLEKLLLPVLLLFNSGKKVCFYGDIFFSVPPLYSGYTDGIHHIIIASFISYSLGIGYYFRMAIICTDVLVLVGINYIPVLFFVPDRFHSLSYHIDSVLVDFYVSFCFRFCKFQTDYFVNSFVLHILINKDLAGTIIYETGIVVLLLNNVHDMAECPYHRCVCTVYAYHFLLRHG